MLPNDGEAIANTAIGSKALFANTTGLDNTAVGFRTLNGNSTGEGNTAVGRAAMFYNTTGSSNSAFGKNALGLTSGDGNTAIGYSALVVNSGNHNTAVGMFAMGGDFSSGNNNTALGYQAGSFNRGSGNVFLGYRAGENETGSNRLYISNDSSDATRILLYGEFDNRVLRSNGRMEINSDNTLNEGLRVIKNYAAGTNSTVSAIYGENIIDDNYGIGVEGKGGRVGLQGTVKGTGILAGYIGVRGVSDGSNGALNFGVHGLASGSSFGNRAVVGEATGSAGDKYGLYGIATGGGATNYGVYGTASGGTTNYAGYFNGNVEVAGKIKVTTIAGATGLDLATSDSYAELRQIRNTTNAGDHNMYFGFDGDAASSINFYNGGTSPSVTMVNKNVGIGTTTPANKLSIVGNADFSGNVGIGVTAPVVKLQVAGGVILTNSPSGSGGNVGIGMSTVTNTKLSILSNQAYGVYINGSSTTAMGAMLVVEGTSQQDIVQIGGTPVGYNLYVTGTAAKTDGLAFWSLPSDARLKEQVTPYHGGLAELLKINPVKYHYTKASGLASNNENIGILAQELKEVAPYMVFKKKGRNTNEEYYNVNLSPMLFMYVNAFKELDAKNKILEEKITRLEVLIKTLAEKK